ncbi:MAG: hypothetical protein NZM28_07365 [Fimbriimonadales bacterium]|nr:hypothetical protein [Fimbriimonadales bacterium]
MIRQLLLEPQHPFQARLNARRGVGWYIRLFGTFALERSGVCVSHFRTAKTGLLMAYLALTPPHRFARELLADLLWGESEPERARHSLNVAISALRHTLDLPDLPAGQVLQVNRATVALNPDHFTTDVLQFEQALTLASRPTLAEAESLDWLQRAVELYRGELLAGCYEPWAVEAAARCQAECLRALRELARRVPSQQAAWLHRIVQLEPLDWRATEQLARLYLQQGQATQAQQVCEHYQSHWKRLYTEPIPKAFADLQAQCANALPTAKPAPQPAARAAARPRKQTVESQLAESGVPRAADAFYGRVRELEQLWAWLIDGEARLATLTGLGGFGKTRLAMEFARRLETRNALPVVWADLQAVPSAELLWDALRNALRLPAAPDPRVQTLNYLRRAHCLLILDNFEQLLPDGVSVVAELLTHAPQVRILVASRAPLEIRGEHTLALAPLSLESEQDGAPAPAVRLFADRAQRVYPDFRLTPERRVQVEQLCRRLDGIPLALELAAARAGVLSPQQMLARLDDRLSWLRTARRDLPVRHRSLHAVLEAAAAALPDEAHAVWTRLAVFRGDFSLDAAQAVCPEADLLAVAEQLRAAGLLQSEARDGALRLHMLDTLREYAWKQLSPDAQRAAQQRLLEWTLAEARTREPMQYRPALSEWLAYWDAEREHLMEALRTAETQGAPAQALELLERTRRYWTLRALHRYAHAIAERLIPQLPPHAQAHARLLQAEWAMYAHRHARAHAHACEALALLPPDENVYQWSLYYAVHAAVCLSDTEFLQQWGETAVQHTLHANEPALQIAGRRMAIWFQSAARLQVSSPYQWFLQTVRQAQQLDDPLWLALALGDWIDHCAVVGRYEETLALAQQLGAIADALQDGERLYDLANARAYCLTQLGRLREADEQLRESLHWAQLSGVDPSSALLQQANLRRLQGNYTEALRTLEQAERSLDDSQKAYALDVRALIERDRGDWQAARRTLERALEQRRADGDAFRLHHTRTHLAYLRCKLGEPDARRELHACLDFWRECDNSPWIAATLVYLAEAQIAAGELNDARAALAESLQRNRAMGRRLQEAMALEQYAALAEAESDPESAQQYRLQADALRAAIGAPRATR